MMIAAALLLAAGAAAMEPRLLRVCAEPDSFPLSNRLGQGLENRLMELLARELGARIEYAWSRGSTLHDLKAERCDVVASAPARSPAALTTKPYYRTGWFFVTRRGDETGPYGAAPAWGPVAGWRARRALGELELSPASDQRVEVSLGVRPDDPELRDALDAALERRAPEVRALLREFDVPQL